MTGRRIQHLQRRSGIYHLRVRVPDDIRSVVGLSEVRRSFRTYQPFRARMLAAVCAARVFEVFAMVKALDLSKEQVRALLQNLFDELAHEVDRSTRVRLSDSELNEQLYCSSEMMANVRAQRAVGAYDSRIRTLASSALAASGLAMSDLADSSNDDLLDGAARAFVQRERLYQLRLADGLAPFVPDDPIFSPEARRTRETRLPVSGPTLADAIDTYLAAKKKTWTSKTYAIRVRYLSYLREHFASGKRLAEVDATDVREFRDAIARLGKNSGRATKLGFLERQASNADHRISAKTVGLVFEPTKAFFRWCQSEQGYLDRNPAENVRAAVAKKAKGKRTRRPFTADELVTLFSAPVFTGCQTVKRRFTVGSEIIQDAYFWIPILGLYSGCRLGELVQLHLADVGSEDGIAFLDITEDGTGPAGSDYAKHVKSEAGIRKVPLHPDVIELGFLDFIAKRRRIHKGSKRLFREIKLGEDEQASTVFSKWFGRMMGRAGLPDPALVFHSLRHNAEDAFRDALVPQYVIDKIVGHSDGAISSQYGQGVSLQVMHEAVRAAKLKIYLPKLWQKIDPPS